ncbi:hypothetical protein QYF36_001017 [Acer negundo]|nr:hypothetical protein QYF36_001017 [Acer negundo]
MRLTTAEGPLEEALKHVPLYKGRTTTTTAEPNQVVDDAAGGNDDSSSSFHDFPDISFPFLKQNECQNLKALDVDRPGEKLNLVHWLKPELSEKRSWEP